VEIPTLWCILVTGCMIAPSSGHSYFMMHITVTGCMIAPSSGNSHFMMHISYWLHDRPF
jgi:hypothetical protein